MKNFKKLSALLTALMIVLSLILPVFAAEFATEEIDESIVWEYDRASNTLTHGETVYEEYYLAPGFLVISPYRYQFSQRISLDIYDSDDSTIKQIVPDHTLPEVLSGIVLVTPYYDFDCSRVYITPECKQVLDAFANGEYASYEFGTGMMQRVDTDGDYWRNLCKGEPDLTIDVLTLRGAQEFFVYGIDQTGNFAQALGSVYQTSDGHGWIYVDYSRLESNQFNDHGTLSMIKGQVPAYSLDASVAADHYRRLDDSGYKSYGIYTEYTLEDNDEPEIDQTPALIGFALMLSPFLYVAPLLVMALGIVLSSIKKIPGRKRWRALIWTSALWLACSLAITVLCVVAILM